MDLWTCWLVDFSKWGWGGIWVGGGFVKKALFSVKGGGEKRALDIFRWTPVGWRGAGLFVFGEVLGEAVDERFEVGVTTHEFEVHIRVFTDAHFIKTAIAVC